MSKRLFTPGPTNVPNEIRDVLAQDVIHHRMSTYHEIVQSVTARLKKIFDTKEDVIILTASGTGAMESSVVNLFSAGDEVLVINTGSFGQRFIELCTTFNLVLHKLDYEWGTSYNLEEVKAILSKNPQIKGIFVTYHETSTGVCNNLEALGTLTKNTELLLIADCISGMVVQPFQMDKWGVDCALASSQKGFDLPPGLSFVALSQKAKKAIETSNLFKYYFDYQKYLSALHSKSEQPFTPAISLVVALNQALDSILSKGLDTIISEKVALRKYTEQKLEAIGFTVLVKEELHRGNVLVPVLPPAHINAKDLCAKLDSMYDLTVAGGMGEYAGKMMRVGILGPITTEAIDDLVEKIQKLTASE